MQGISKYGFNIYWVGQPISDLEPINLNKRSPLSWYTSVNWCTVYINLNTYLLIAYLRQEAQDKENLWNYDPFHYSY